MSLLPTLPIELLVRGTAMSLGASSRSQQRWRASIQAEIRATLPEGYWILTDPVSVVIFIFPGAAMVGDIDNRVKPILDAMNKCVYADDRLVERLLVQKFETMHVTAISDPSDRLLAAMVAEPPLVYIKIDLLDRLPDSTR